VAGVALVRHLLSHAERLGEARIPDRVAIYPGRTTDIPAQAA